MYSVLLPRILLMGRWGARPVRNAIAVAASVAVIGGGAVWGPGIINPGGGAPAGTANLWIDTNGGTCTRQASPAAYSDAAACASFAAAFTAASAGDTVRIKCGTSYGAQTLSGTAKSSAVSFYAETYDQPTSAAGVVAATTCVTITGLSISTSRVHVTGVQVTGGDTFLSAADQELYAEGALTDVVIDGWHGHQAGIYATGVTIQYSKLGDANFCGSGYNFDEDALRFWMASAPSDNDKLLHSVIRNWVGPPDGQCGQANGHNDMFQTPGGDNMVFDGNLFYNGPTSNMQVGEFSGGVIGSLTIQNNYFGPTEGSNSLSIGQGHCGGIVIQNNVIAYPQNGMPTNNNGCSGTMTQRNNVYVGNLSSCGPSTFSGSYNTFASGGVTCGTNAQRCDPSWAAGPPPSDGSAWQPTLNSGDTCVKDYIPGASTFPTSDFYGTARPVGANADGGPYEVP